MAAGTALDAIASVHPLPGALERRTLHLPAAKTRTRLSHGSFPLGDLVASVHSSRRESDGRVTLAVGQAAVRLDLSMSPQQARAMAQVLSVAARAAETSSASRAIAEHGGAA